MHDLQGVVLDFPFRLAVPCLKMHCGETLLPFTLHWPMPTLECVVHREGDHQKLILHLSCGMRAYASQAVIIACMRCRILHTQSIFLSPLPCAGLFFDVSSASPHPHSPLPPAHPSRFRFLLILLFFFIWEGWDHGGSQWPTPWSGCFSCM
ncbi:unnamed protein product [Trypanosoma congolense IL3000]|uniref:WGS project CAEQ00000000 data, annotated contig 677 n=1 Tax=Trypanosoma congolense (strain IL3000) TaxID=1068625 RepID=F9WHP1_TRYCI|nr:unnamed protein product [Trypanosoma congolense IL3000]